MSPRVLVIAPTSGLAEEFVRAVPGSWTFEAVGRRASEAQASRYQTTHVVEATETGPLEFAVRANDCDTVVSFLQEGDRARCQEERPLPGAVPSGVAWAVNVEATEAIARAALPERKHVIVLSTDEVFAEEAGPAVEASVPLPAEENPSWYGGTWAEAEARLGRMGGSVAIVRVSALFGWSGDSLCGDRALVDLVHRPAELVQPTYVPDVLRVLQRLVEEPRAGVFHVALPQAITRRQLQGRLRDVGRLSGGPVVPERHPGLVPGRIADLGVEPTAWEATAALPRPVDRR